jgi:hypothetical protein
MIRSRAVSIIPAGVLLRQRAATRRKPTPMDSFATEIEGKLLFLEPSSDANGCRRAIRVRSLHIFDRSRAAMASSRESGERSLHVPDWKMLAMNSSLPGIDSFFAGMNSSLLFFE